MPRVFWPNYHFEQELSRGTTTASILPARLIDDRFWSWTAIADPDDVIVAPRIVALDAEFPHPRFCTPESLPRGSEWEFVAWGWSAAALARGRRAGLASSGSDPAVVREVNRRSFRWRLERDLGVLDPRSALVENAADLDAALDQLADAPRGWVLKAEFGMSARERLLGRGPLDEPERRWAEKRLAQDGVLIVEPWLDRVAEAGLQFEIPADAPPTCLGVVPLLTDAAGRYVGSLVPPTAHEMPEWTAAVQTGLEVARRVQAAGYAGPMGLDAMRWRDADGREHIRPLQDLNARWTMGRLAFGWRRRLHSDDWGLWLQGPAERIRRALANFPAGLRWQATSPPAPWQSGLVISPARETLATLWGTFATGAAPEEQLG